MRVTCAVARVQPGGGKPLSFFFSSRRRHTRWNCDWSSDVCSSDLETDWIAQHFFTGGLMPSHRLIEQVADRFAVEREWRWNGRHYQRTALDWLANFDRSEERRVGEECRSERGGEDCKREAGWRGGG